MGSSQYKQFLYNKIPFLSHIAGGIVFGATGAVSSSTSGVGIKAITRLATGVYQIQLQNIYQALVGSFFTPQSAASGTNVTAGSFVTGVLYKITSLGSTVWASAGLNAGLTAAVGQTFVASGVGAGTGVAQAIIPSQMDVINIPTNPQLMLATLSSTPLFGGYVQFNTISRKAVAFTADTHTNTTVDNISSMTGLAVGQVIAGAGIPRGATIATIAGASSITISAAATATASTVPMTSLPAYVYSDPVSGSALHFDLFLRGSSSGF